jgi:dTMP kinase
MEAETRARGRFITLEGPDGAGKTGQATRLAEALRAAGRTVTLTREPGGTRLGERIRAALLDTDVLHVARADALLFNAARAELVDEVIVPALSRGEIVVCDRFADSTLAYQGYGAGLDLAELRRLADWGTGGLVPDLTILLDVPVAVGLERRERGPAGERSRFEDASRHPGEFHERVRAGFLALAAADLDRWRTVDGSAGADDVAAAVLDAVASVLRFDEPLAAVERMRA